MRMLLVVCLVFGGCSRDLTPVTDRNTEPAYLGEMSGLYELSLAIPDGDEGLVELPFGSRLQILHLRDPGGEVDLLLGIEEEPYFRDVGAAGGVEVEPYQRLFFEAGFDGVYFKGDSNRGDLVGKRLAGGGMIALDNIVPICESGARYRLTGKLICPVNPALSGVYGGEATSCDGGASSERFLAVGFIDESFLGLLYPGSETLVEGFYSHAQETGVGFSYGLDWTGGFQGSELWINLDEADGVLNLSGQLYAWDDAALGAPVCETMDLSRLAGGTPTDCYADDVAPAVGTAVTRRDFGESGGRYLFVETQFDDLPAEAGMVAADGVLRRADDVSITIPPEHPDPCTFDCPCDLDCCVCNTTFECDANCDCDWDCYPACWCAVGTDGVCNGDCRCDEDCYSMCTCNTDETCTPDCFCDPDCTCDCERPPGYALRFLLPPVPSGTVEYELFLGIYDPYFYGELPTAPRCIIDDGGIDFDAQPPPPPGP